MEEWNSSQEGNSYMEFNFFERLTEEEEEENWNDTIRSAMSKSEATGIPFDTLWGWNSHCLMPKLSKGERFGKLKILELAGSIKSHRYWYCECECGVWVLASTSDLRSSCPACAINQIKETNYRHGHNIITNRQLNTTHGDA